MFPKNVIFFENDYERWRARQYLDLPCRIKAKNCERKNYSWPKRKSNLFERYVLILRCVRRLTFLYDQNTEQLVPAKNQFAGPQIGTESPFDQKKEYTHLLRDPARDCKEGNDFFQ